MLPPLGELCQDGFVQQSDSNAAIAHRLATACMRRSHSSRPPRKPSPYAVSKICDPSGSCSALITESSDSNIAYRGSEPFQCIFKGAPPAYLNILAVKVPVEADSRGQSKKNRYR